MWLGGVGRRRQEEGGVGRGRREGEKREVMRVRGGEGGRDEGEEDRVERRGMC